MSFVNEYDRERLALYLVGLLPDDPQEGEEVIALMRQLMPVLAASRANKAQINIEHQDGD